MGSKSKRRHAQKPYNRAQNKPQAATDAALAPAVDAESTVASAPIVTAKELRQAEKEKRQREKAAQREQAKKDKEKAKKNGEKKPFFLIRFFKWLGRGCAGIFSELKKVHWPTFKQVMKATGIVLGIVVGFGIVLLGIWELFGFLYRLLIGM